jgi:putative transposase
MPISPKYYAKFEHDSFYHIYNRSNGSENLIFHTQENYYYFLRLVKEHLSSLLDIWAFCLLPNHFHIMAKVSHKNEDVNEKVVKAFQRLFISYSQAINSQEKIRGSVFQKRFKRIHVNSDLYITRLIHYIHFNPVSHGYVTRLAEYGYSSYNLFLSEKETSLPREEVFEWFGGRDRFLEFHSQSRDFKELGDAILE